VGNTTLILVQKITGAWVGQLKLLAQQSQVLVAARRKEAKVTLLSDAYGIVHETSSPIH
jgi:hypothetical protein